MHGQNHIKDGSIL